MGLSPYPPKSDDKGNIRSIKSYLLGERYLFTYIDIEPDLSALDKKYEKDLTAKFGEIDSKYNSIILAEINRYMADVSAKTQEKFDLQLDEYKTELDDRLDSDVINNSDKDVCKVYQSEIARLLSPIETERKKLLSSIRAKIDQIRRSKPSTIEKDEQINALSSKESASNDEYNKRIERAKSQVSLRDFYIRRNTALIEKKQKSLAIRYQEELDKLKKEKKNQLEFQYAESIDSEKTEIRNVLLQKLNEDKADKIENETIRRYQIYFRPQDITDKVKKSKSKSRKLLRNILPTIIVRKKQK